jgi:hypothetical protein
VLGTADHTIVALFRLLAATYLLPERGAEQPQDPQMSRLIPSNRTTRPATSAISRGELVERCGEAAAIGVATTSLRIELLLRNFKE